jgi:hypothetical protein
MRSGRFLVVLAIIAIVIAALGAALVPGNAAPPAPCIGGATVILNGQEQCVDVPSAPR